MSTFTQYQELGTWIFKLMSLFFQDVQVRAQLIAWSQGAAPGSKQEASTPIAEEKENNLPAFDGDTTIEEPTSIVNESYENSSSWESYEGNQAWKDMIAEFGNWN